MQTPLDQIVYPGSDQYSADAMSAPGSVPLSLHGDPLVRALNTAYIIFEVPDLDRQKAFLQDFGLLEAQRADDSR